jgi:NAD(P)-dependent dehydrogenase (short-subunit alcohol dehydrogenase family)
MSVILITGSNSGIGMSTALHLASKGHRVYASMRDLKRGDDLRQAAAARGITPQLIELDVTSPESVQRAVAKVLQDEGRIDVLVNNAGIAPFGTIEESDDAMAKTIFETNFFGALRMIRGVLPAMRKQQSGTIINMSSIAGRVSVGCLGIYSASKFALEAASEALAQEVLPYGIRVRILEPGFIVTPILDRVLGSLAAVAGSTAYPHVIERTQLVFTQARQIGGQPELVADLVEEAMSDPSLRLRYMAGDTAQVFFDGRSRMSDEEWVALGRHTTVQDYFQEWGTRFPMKN